MFFTLGSLRRTVPVSSDVQRIRSTATDVYINAQGLASYTMGPGFTSGGGLFGFWPLSKGYQVRRTRNPVPAGTKTKHPGGMIGMMVNGVAIYDLGDAFSCNQTNAAAPTATTVLGVDVMGAGGDGYWSRDALAVEVVTFDPGFAHQPGHNGQYHYHAGPKALRHQFGDNMTATSNAAGNTFTYTETDPSGAITTLHHSPILGWSFDGYPIYGPYGYGTATNASSAVRRMKSGFVLRNAANAVTYGTADLVATGRITLPRWAAIAQGYVTGGTGDYSLTPLAQYGPGTTYQTTGPGGITTYTLGRYTGDYDYLGDRGRTQGVDFDLDQYNGRNCVTPDFPGGSYAYFVSIDASGNPAFPYMLGKQFYGTTNDTTAATVPVGAVELFNGGPNTQERLAAPSVNPANGTITLVWTSVEGGTYKVEASSALTTNSWVTVTSAVSADEPRSLHAMKICALTLPRPLHSRSGNTFCVPTGIFTASTRGRRWTPGNNSNTTTT